MSLIVPGGIDTIAPGASADELLEWVEPDGTIAPLDQDNGVIVMPGMVGRFIAPVAHTETITPGRHGSVHQATRYTAKEVAIPVAFIADTRLELRDIERAWIRRLDPSRGEGKLRSTSHDGLTRYLHCRYAGGLDQMIDDNEQLGAVRRGLLIVRAFDPFWWGTTSESDEWQPDVVVVTFFPILPFTLGGSEELVVDTVDNDGDGDAFPVWTLTGPFDQITLDNETTGATLVLNYSATDGEVVTIDTRPGHQAITSGATTLSLDYVTPLSTLWVFQPGLNAFRIATIGTTSDSIIAVTWQKRYLTP